jgi:hypothetical protein
MRQTCAGTSGFPAFFGQPRRLGFAMAFSRRWLLVLFALILGGGQLFAATLEERAYAAAVAAFNQHL